MTRTPLMVRPWTNWSGPPGVRGVVVATICQLTCSDYSRGMVLQRGFPAALARDRLIHGFPRSRLLPFAGSAFVPEEDPRGFRFSVDRVSTGTGFARYSHETGRNETRQKERKWSLLYISNSLVRVVH